MTIVLALGFAVSVLIFFAIYLGGRYYIDTVYMADEQVKEREEKYKEDLQKFVHDNGLTVNDKSKLGEWAEENRYVYLYILRGEELWFDSLDKPDDENGSEADPENPDTGDGSTDDGDNSDNTADKGDGYKPPSFSSKPTKEELEEMALSKGQYVIYTTLEDGVEDVDGSLAAYFVDYSEYLYYDIVTAASLFTAVAVFFVIMWVYFYSITIRITSLGKEVTIVADGNTAHAIAVSGDDEIARLAMDIEQMRSSMLENVKKERAALDANKELITAMSHDIRTPLTVLLGYLDIMKSSANDDSMKEYLDASEKTALRLKKMSDDMFGYFLVYGGNVEVEMGEYDARTLVDQLMSGHIFLLREQGYNINYNFENEDTSFLENVTVYTDPSRLMRVVENIFSNLLKYADETKEITVKIVPETDEIVMQINNFIKPNPDRTQSNGIGLKSCMKIASAMDIRFSGYELDGIYEYMLCIPIIPNIEYADTENDNNRFVKWLINLKNSVFGSIARIFVRDIDKSEIPKSDATEQDSDSGEAVPDVQADDCSNDVEGESGEVAEDSTEAENE